jgi:Na+/melibiose symporter-like transporter
MLIFETKIKLLQYFLSSLGCFYIFPVFYLCFYANKNNDLGLFFLGAIFIILGIVQFSFTLKSFQLHSDFLIVKRPMFIFNPKRTFQKSEIVKIIFRQSTSRIGGGNYLIVNTKNSEESFMLIYSSKTLKELITKLKEVEIETDVEFKIE